MSLALTPGTRLGPYEIVAAIGAGGMGEVLRARDTKLGREVAIKVLPAAFVQDAERVARFRREAQMTGEPDWTELPPQARRLVKACLQKDPKRRLRDIGDAWSLPEELPVDGRADTATASGRRLWPWLGGAAAGLLLGALAMVRFGSPSAPVPVGEATLRTLVSGGPSSDPSLAPDGKTLAFTSIRNGEMRVWIKDLVSGSESALGPSPSSKPTFSPDGTSVLFEKEGSLHRIAAWSPSGTRRAARSCTAPPRRATS